MFLEDLKNSTALFLNRYLRLSANAATYLGLFFAYIAGFMAYEGIFFYAAVCLAISGFLDLMDGAIARASGKAAPFGGILDSTLDRYGDFFILAGIALYYFNERLIAGVVLALVALIGFFSVSYVRARAECVIPSARVGFWERGERLVYLILGLALNNLAVALWVLAIGTNLTAFYRLYSAAQGGRQSGKKANFFCQTYGRLHPFYWVKVGVLLGVLFFVRLAF